MLAKSFASRVQQITLFAAALVGTTAQAAITVTPSAVSAGMVTLTFNSSTAGTGSWVLLQSGSCGTPAQTQAGQGSTGAAAYRQGSLALAAGTDGLYTVRNLVQSQSYTVCATNGTDTHSATFSTPAMAAYGSPVWQTVGSAGFSAGAAIYQSLAFAPDGTPYVAYQDTVSTTSKTTVMRYDGSGWVTVGSPGFSAGTASYQSLAFAPDGAPYVAYRDGGNSNNTTVMRYDGSNWVPVGTSGFSAGGATYQTLAFAPDGVPYVAYKDGGASSKTTVMRYDGNSWVPVGSRGFSAIAQTYQSLAFAPDGTPYVAYWGSIAFPTTVITVMRYDGSSWVPVGSPRFYAGKTYAQSLAFSPSGIPYLAYRDEANGGKATVMRYDGTDWVVVGSPGFSAGAATYLSLAFAPDGAPYVVYEAPNYQVTVTRFDGSSWVAVASIGLPVGESLTAPFTAAFSPDGAPYLAYWDYSNDRKATVTRLTGTAAAPTAVTVVLGITQATVSFTPPASNGGSAITSYTVTAAPGGASCTAVVPATSCVVTGLSHGTPYTFTVVANNAAGASPASAPSAAVPLAAATPASIPTLSEWALLLVSALLAANAGLALRRRSL